MWDEDIVHAIRNNRIKYDVGSPHPGGGEASKGLAVRQLKRNVSWVQTVNQNLLLLASLAASDSNIGMKNRLISVKSYHIEIQPVIC